MTRKIYFGKTIYSVRESYKLFYEGLRSSGDLLRARRNGELDPQYVERLMLAVTEVNGCALCAWGHTRMALETGMRDEEVRLLLSGDLAQVPAGELPAILFAQHYADTRGRPSREAWQRVVDIYGATKARGILGAIRMIMIGNAYGIAGGALLSRWRGRPDPRSSLGYELGMAGGAVLTLPVALVHAGVAGLTRQPVISFSPPPATAEPV